MLEVATLERNPKCINKALHCGFSGPCHLHLVRHRYRHVLYIAAPAVWRLRSGNTHAWIWYIDIRTGEWLSDSDIGLVIVGALVHAFVLLVHAVVGSVQENSIHLGDGPASCVSAAC